MSGSTKIVGTKRNLAAKKPADAPKGDAAAVPAKRRPGSERKPDTAKPENLVCRYCRSADLSPSFIKRRDRRCRKCFSKRYGSQARTKKTGKKK